MFFPDCSSSVVDNGIIVATIDSSIFSLIFEIKTFKFDSKHDWGYLYKGYEYYLSYLWMFVTVFVVDKRQKATYNDLAKHQSKSGISRLRRRVAVGKRKAQIFPCAHQIRSTVSFARCTG